MDEVEVVEQTGSAAGEVVLLGIEQLVPAEDNPRREVGDVSGGWRLDLTSSSPSNADGMRSSQLENADGPVHETTRRRWPRTKDRRFPSSRRPSPPWRSTRERPQLLAPSATASARRPPST